MKAVNFTQVLVFVLMAVTASLKAQCPPLPSPGHLTPTCPVKLVQINGFSPNGDGVLFTQVWRDTEAVDKNGNGNNRGLQEQIDSIFTGFDAFGLPLHPNQVSTTINWPTLGITYSASGSEPTSSSIQYLWPKCTGNCNGNNADRGVEQAQQDGWLIIPDSIQCIEFRVRGIYGKSMSLYLSQDGTMANMVKVIEAFDSAGVSGAVATWTIPVNLPISDLGQGFRYTRLRLYHHDALNLADTRVQWDIGDGLVNIPPQYIQSVPSADAVVNQPSGMKRQGGEFAFRDTLGFLFGADYPGPTLGQPILLDTRFKQSDSILVHDVISGSACDNVFVCGPLQLVAVRQRRPSNLTGHMYFQHWTNTNTVSSQTPGQQDFLEAFNSGASLPSHPNLPSTDTTSNPSNAFGLFVNSNQPLFQATFDAWILVPANVPCVQFQLGTNPSTTQATALFLGSNYFSLTRVAMEVNGAQEGGTYCLSGNHANANMLGWKWVRARLYIHDDGGGAHDSRVKWNLGRGFDYIPANRIYPCINSQDNSLPTIQASLTIVSSTEYGLLDTSGKTWAENGFQQPTVPIRTKEYLDVGIEVAPLGGCASQPNPTTGSTCQATLDADPCNRPPIAVADRDTTVQDVSIYLLPLANDYDPDIADSVALHIVSISSVPGLALPPTIRGQDTIEFHPGMGNFGDDQFDYVVCDDGTPPLCDTATFFIRISKDIDLDRVPDERDLDNDNDGISDQIECLTARTGGNSDSDHFDDAFDLDADNDGLPDIVEFGWVRQDSNGKVPLDTNRLLANDPNRNGWDDDFENLIGFDADADGIPDFQDLDSDNDGRYDIQEAGMGGLSADGIFMNLIDPDTNGWDNRALAATHEVDPDLDTVPAWRDLDADNDGIPNIREERLPDIDGDGRLDAISDPDSNGVDHTRMIVVMLDSDQDGIHNVHDLDSDNDGIADLVEYGRVDTDSSGGAGTPLVDVNRDGWQDSPSQAGISDYDADGFPDFIDLDSDNDGLYDRDEEVGRPNSRFGLVVVFTDPLHTGWDEDERLHGVRDWDSDLVPDRYDLDTDNDGIPDVIESGGRDAGPIDGMVDGLLDVNQDGADDAQMLVQWPHHDGDAITNHHDLDADNDGLLDLREGGRYTTGPTVVMVPGSDPDGWDNSIPHPGIRNADSDPLPDRIDLDSDNDGISDIYEAMRTGFAARWDSNQDGRVDTLQGFPGPGWFAAVAIPTYVDTDQDNLPDYIDLDSDNDGLADLFEDQPGQNNLVGTLTVIIDANGDGMDDNFASNARTDWDQDSIPDFRDLDSDQDGIADVIEAGYRDDQGGPGNKPDGRIDIFVDADGDGWLDNPLAARVDQDGDGYPTQRDRDSDNDGIPDIIEGSGIYPIPGGYVVDLFDSLVVDGWDDQKAILVPLDSDADGNPDYLDLDSDNDQLMDVIEGSADTILILMSRLDANADGMLDQFVDMDGYGWDFSHGTIQPKNTDNDRDPIFPALPWPDYRDPDADGDGFSDFDESQFAFAQNDCNQDGKPDWLEAFPCDVKFYQGFSPNGDGLNDEFWVDGIDYHKENSFTVFNRWGAMIYRDEDWDGKWNGVANQGLYAEGAPAPNGLYYYVFEFEGQSQPQRGYFYLRR